MATTYIVYNKALKISNAALRATTVGHIMNILSKDVTSFDNSLVYAHYLYVGPLQMFCIIGLLWYEIGISCLAGIAVMVLYLPLQGLMGRLFGQLRVKSTALTDNRLRLMSEILTPENVFVTLSLVNQLRDSMTLSFPWALSLGAEALVSLKRIEVHTSWSYKIPIIYKNIFT